MILSRKLTNATYAFITLFFLFSFLLFGCGGAGKAVYKIDPAQMSAYPEKKKLDYAVDLQLSPQLCNQKYFVGAGLTYYADIGEALCINAEWMADNLFRKVIVTHGAEAEGANLTLTPQILFIHKTTPLFEPETAQPREVRGKYSWDQLTIGLFVKWTLADAKGKVKWVDIVQGLGKGSMGGPFSYRANSREQIRMALEDMFRKTHEVLWLSFNKSGGDKIGQAYPYEYLNWTIARNRDSVSSYDHFLNHFPKGLFSDQAKKARDEAFMREPDATTLFCDGWSKIKIGMMKEAVGQIMTAHKMGGAILDMKGITTLKKGAKPEDNLLIKTSLWAAKFENEILTGKRREVVCDEWRDYFYPFLRGYLK